MIKFVTIIQSHEVRPQFLHRKYSFIRNIKDIVREPRVRVNVEIVLRKDAKIKGLQYYFTGKRCKRGHVVKRLTSNGSCIECARNVSRRTAKRYYRNNRDSVLTYQQKYYQQHKEIIKQRVSTRYYSLDKLQLYEMWQEYRTENHSTIIANSAKYRAKKLNATPYWSEFEEIRKIYAEAQRLTEETGIQMHVDHIVPLQGENVSGLHVLANLQVITADENIRKGNRFICV